MICYIHFFSDWVGTSVSTISNPLRSTTNLIERYIQQLGRKKPKVKKNDENTFATKLDIIISFVYDFFILTKTSKIRFMALPLSQTLR